MIVRQGRKGTGAACVRFFAYLDCFEMTGLKHKNGIRVFAAFRWLTKKTHCVRRGPGKQKHWEKKRNPPYVKQKKDNILLECLSTACVSF